MPWEALVGRPAARSPAQGRADARESGKGEGCQECDAAADHNDSIGPSVGRIAATNGLSRPAKDWEGVNHGVHSGCGTFAPLMSSQKIIGNSPKRSGIVAWETTWLYAGKTMDVTLLVT